MRNNCKCLMVLLDVLGGNQAWYPADALPEAETLRAAGFITIEESPRVAADGAGDRGFVARITELGTRVLSGSCLSVDAFGEVLDLALARGGIPSVA